MRKMEPAWDRLHNNRTADTLEKYAKHQGEEQHGEEHVATTSILDALKAPALSDLTRKRKVHCNPPKGKRRAHGEGSSEPKNVTAYFYRNNERIIGPFIGIIGKTF